MPFTTGSTVACNAAITCAGRCGNKKWAEAHLCPTPSKLLKFNRIWDLAPLSRRQIARQLDAPIAHAQEPAHARAHGLEHAAHFAVTPFLERHAIPAVCATSGPRVRRLDALEGGRSIRELDAAAQLFNIGGTQFTLHAHRVLALELVARVHQPVCQLAIVGKEQEPGAIEVETAYCNPAARRQPGKHRRPALRIAGGDELAFRLVIDEDAPACLGSELDRA